jgi:prepilin-type N-terminal cleavage/methylation domain-containing protein
MMHTTHNGFSLVELSIVLVILGLLIGGILSGQALIRAAELRSVTTEYNNYSAAVQTFRDKYMAIPGDMREATRFWGRMNSNADCITNSATAVSAAGVCDGDGNGVMNSPGAASQAGEIFQVWRQLALAGLIEGSYTGIAGSGGSADSVIGTNVPRSRLSNSGWSTWNITGTLSYYPGENSAWFAGDYGNPLIFGGLAPTTIPEVANLKPEEAWNIDTKVDDGKPATGRVVPREVATFSGAAGAKCTNATSSTDFAASYNLSNSAIGCSLKFMRVF